VGLHGCLGLAERGPGEKGQAQVDGGGVESVSSVRKLHCKLVVAVEGPCHPDQQLREVGPDAPVAVFVGMGEGALGYLATDAHVIKLGWMRPEATFDISQTLAVCKLSECHAQELIHAGKGFDVSFSAVVSHTGCEFLVR